MYLWESREDAEQELPSRARELIGKEPDIGEEFDVEATIEGQFLVQALSRRGLAFDSSHRWRAEFPNTIASGRRHGYLRRGQVVKGRSLPGRPRRHRTAPSGTGVRSKDDSPSSNSSATALPTAGDCMNPWPENPHAA